MEDLNQDFRILYNARDAFTFHKIINALNINTATKHEKQKLWQAKKTTSQKQKNTKPK